MAKMSKAQRTAILDFYNGVTRKGHTLIADSRTIATLIRNGWATFGPGVSTAWALRAKQRSAYVTRAGLIAAGIDLDAIHAQALAEFASFKAERRTAITGMHDLTDEEGRRSPNRTRHFEMAHAEALHFNAALNADACPTPPACLHAGCHPGRCVYGPDHGVMSCPRQCGVDVREHHSSDLVNGGCDTGPMSAEDTREWFAARGVGQPGCYTMTEALAEFYGKSEAELERFYDEICGSMA